MPAATGTAAALGFVWLGMVLAISFLEAPLKFRAPGVTLPLGLGIGRVVFRALNSVEVLLALAIAVALVAAVVVGDPDVLAAAAYVVAAGSLAVQLLVVRPRLSRRSDAVLAGETGPRSHAHLGYVALEVVKVAALVTLGTVLLAG